ncbi:MAG: SMR family transporter [Candidatus Magasanikbacteria bacterium]
MTFFWYIVVLSVIDVAAITLAKQWQVSNQWYWLVASMFLFCLMPIVFARSTTFAPSSIVNAVWVATSSILITITGYLIFKEHLNTNQMTGLLVVIIGLIIIEIK